MLFHRNDNVVISVGGTTYSRWFHLRKGNAISSAFPKKNAEWGDGLTLSESSTDFVFDVFPYHEMSKRVLLVSTDVVFSPRLNHTVGAGLQSRQRGHVK